MKVIKKEFQMNGISISWGARCLVFGFSAGLVGFGIQNPIVFIVGISLLAFGISLIISKTTISLDSEKGELTMKYKTLYTGKGLTHKVQESDYITFYNEKHNPNKVDFMFVSTNWYPVKDSSYFIVLQPENEDLIVLTECIDLKETYAVCKEFSSQTGLEFKSPLKSRGR